MFAEAEFHNDSKNEGARKELRAFSTTKSNQFREKEKTFQINRDELACTC